MLNNPVVIKHAETVDELQGKGYVHYKSWQESYPGLIDDEYLKRMSLSKCTEIALKYPSNILVAKDGEKVIGFAGYGTYRDETMSNCGEVYALYVLEAYHGKHVGYELMKAAVAQLAQYPRIAVWVLKDNEKAIRFYQRFGYVFDGTEAEITLGRPVTELRMIYQR